MDLKSVAKTFDVIGISPPEKLTLFDARTLSGAHTPPFPPDMPALLTNVDSSGLARHLKQVLLTTYPQEHVIYVVEAGQRKEERLEDIDERNVSENMSFYVPALGEGTSFESFAEIVAHLRAPNG
ncbi:MAG TPA: hypothetical protein VFY83_07095, partial [Anaerolineales bacterium]|nr:hypothetical protein [Anaerolineales bacterium]